MFRPLALILALSLAGGARADEPLPAPADYARTTPNGAFRVTATVETALTSIESIGDRPVPMWFIDGWQRNVLVADDGRSALVLPEGMPLIGFDAPDSPLLSFHRPSGASVTHYLGEVMDPATLVPTASNWLWAQSARAEPGVFVIVLVDGSEVRIDADDGSILSSPVGQKRTTDARIVGAPTDGPCVTWADFRAGATSLGPRYPIPELPEPFAQGCVTGYADNQVDVLTVFEAGVVPQAPDAEPEGFFASQDPLYGIVPLPAGDGTVGGRTVEVAFSTSMGVGTQDFFLTESWEAPHVYDSGGVTFRGIGIYGLPTEQAVAALLATRDAYVDGARDIASMRLANRLALLPDGRHHLAAVQRMPGAWSMMFDKTGDVIAGAGYHANTDSFGCFVVSLAGDGTTGTGDSGYPDAAAMDDADAPRYAVSRGESFDFDAGGPLRPLPEDERRVRETEWGLVETTEACLAAIRG